MYCLLHRASYFQMEKIWKKKLDRLKKWRVHRDPRVILEQQVRRAQKEIQEQKEQLGQQARREPTLDKEEVIGIRELQ